jgi:hypothetical protein
MGYFLAVNDKQLGLCLRMLYADGLGATVKTVRNDRGKIEFHIKAEADEDYFNELLERYTILIS